MIDYKKTGFDIYKRPKFRLRRWFFGRHYNNSLVKLIAKQSIKNVANFSNEDRNIHRNGESALQDVVLEYYQSKNISPIVFDVGAHVGFWSYLLLTKKPDLHIECFEPSEQTYQKLSSNLKDFNNVNINNFGLSNKDQSITFWENYTSDVTSKYMQHGSKNAKKIDVQLSTGDDFVCERKIDKINILKLDIEGMEYDALEGFANLIQAQKIDVIQFEYGEFNIESRRLLKDFWDILKGYELGRLHPTAVEFCEWSPRIENFKDANYVAVSSDLVELRNRLKAF